jgi:hypothetical protein
MHMDCRTCLADFVSIRWARAGCKLVEPPLTPWRLSTPNKDVFSIGALLMLGGAVSQTDNGVFPESVLQHVMERQARNRR